MAKFIGELEALNQAVPELIIGRFPTMPLEPFEQAF